MNLKGETVLGTVDGVNVTVIEFEGQRAVADKFGQKESYSFFVLEHQGRVLAKGEGPSNRFTKAGNDFINDSPTGESEEKKEAAREAKRQSVGKGTKDAESKDTGGDEGVRVRPSGTQGSSQSRGQSRK